MESMVFKSENESRLGVMVTVRGHKGDFWGAGDVLFLDLRAGYTGMW